MTTPTTLALTRTVDGAEIPAPGTYAVDAAHSSVSFVSRHLMVAKVRGRFEQVEGEIVVAEDPARSSARATIAAASINTADASRDGHLRSGDFLDVENYPSLEFSTRSLVPGRGGRWTVDGELTIKGVTRPARLEATFEGALPDPFGNQRIILAAAGEIDREEYGITWNQALETGGVLVGRKVKVEIEVEATRVA
ncbi:MAG: YceI family protein [Acidimicrobiales bacterium]